MAKVFETYRVHYTAPKPADAELLFVHSIGHYKAFNGFTLDRSAGHSVEHLIYTIDGASTGVIAGERSLAQAGSVWLMPKDKPYQYWCDVKDGFWEGRWIEYDGRWARQLWTMMGLNGVTHVPLCFEAQPIVEELQTSLHTDGDRANHVAAALLWKLFAVLERAVSGSNRDKVGRGGIHAAQQFVLDHLRDPIALADLARAANLSPFHFARVFRDRTGFTPAVYVRSVRINRARELLRQGDLSIKQIGQAVGYGQPHHFSAVFKQATGLSPREFVRAHRGS